MLKKNIFSIIRKDKAYGKWKTRRITITNKKEKWKMNRVRDINHVTRKRRKNKNSKRNDKKDLDINLICEVTKLSKEEIEKIVKEK